MFNNRNHHVMDSGQSRSLLQKVYSWMALALGITSLTAYMVANSNAMYYLLAHPMLFWGLALVQIGLVISLSAAIHRMSTETAMAIFLGYSNINFDDEVLRKEFFKSLKKHWYLKQNHLMFSRNTPNIIIKKHLCISINRAFL